MSFWRIIFNSIRQHIGSSILAVVSIWLGVALLIAVFSLREQTHKTFTEIGTGIDAVLGPKGSPLQIVLNAVYHLEEMPGKLKWTYMKEVEKSPIVVEAIPFCTGHSYAGYRVNAIDRRFLTDFEYMPGHKFSFAEKEGGQGRPFNDAKEAVAGWEVAKKLHIKLGQTFNPVCGVKSGDPIHVNDFIVFVGILAPTGTPHDRAIYFPLNTFYGLEGHGAATAKMASDEKYREISGAYLKIKRIRGGAMHPGVQDLKFGIDQSTEAQLVIPREVLPRLFSIIGWVDYVFIAVSFMVLALAGMFLFVALLSALRQRRRDMAIMRCLGATRRTVFGLVLSEALIICIIGGLLGLVFGHILVGIGAEQMKAETGIQFSGFYICTIDYLLLPALFVIGILTGLIPAIQAYRMGVLRNLLPIS